MGSAPAAGAGNSRRPAPAAGWSNRSPAATGRAGRSAPGAPTGRNGPAGGADGPGGSPAAPTTASPDICDACFRLPEAVCSRCGRRRPCSFATGPEPDLHRLRPAGDGGLRALRRRTAHRPPAGPRDRSATPATPPRCAAAAPAPAAAAERRLVAPPGPDATTCADCAGAAQPPLTPAPTAASRTSSTNAAAAHPARCAAAPGDSAPRRRRADPPRAGTGLRGDHRHRRPTHRAELAAQRRRRRRAGRDGRRRNGSAPTRRWTPTPAGAPPDYLRAVLVANQVLPRPRRTTGRRRTIPDPNPGRHHPRRRPSAGPRLRHLAGAAPAPAHAPNTARPAPQLHPPRPHQHHRRRRSPGLARRPRNHPGRRRPGRHRHLPGRRRRPRYQVRDFLHWAADGRHCRPCTSPRPGRTPGPAAASDDERWAQIARLLHDDTIELTDRVAGALLLLYGQQLSRIAAITLDQVKTVGAQVFLRFGRDDLHIPEPLAGLLPDPDPRRPPLHRRRLPGHHPMAVPRPATRPAAHRRPARRTPPQTRHPSPTRPPRRADPPRRPTTRRRPRRSARHRTPPPPSTGSTTPAATGTATPPNSPETGNHQP